MAVDWLIVGLGNPGREYENTPHNVGFRVAERLRERWGLPRPKARYRGLLTDGRAAVGEPRDGASSLAAAGGSGGGGGGGGLRVAILMPQTYMNDAGRSVGPARGELRVELDRLLVIHDEIDLPFGDIRTRLGGGLAGHNGLKSLKAALGSAEFRRVRIGVGRPPTTDPDRVAAYVLGRFQQSRDEVDALVERAADAAEQVLRDGDQQP